MVCEHGGSAKALGMIFLSVLGEMYTGLPCRPFYVFSTLRPRTPSEPGALRLSCRWSDVGVKSKTPIRPCCRLPIVTLIFTALGRGVYIRVPVVCATPGGEVIFRREGGPKPSRLLTQVLTIPARVDDSRAGVASTIPANLRYFRGCFKGGMPP